MFYGFLRDVEVLRKRFGSNDVVFCFDLGRNKRRDIYPQYKQKDRIETPEQTAMKVEVYSQLDHLREQYLPELGYVNIFSQKGHEADDLIASVVDRSIVRGEDRAVICSADKDLYQLLRPGVKVHHPRTKDTSETVGCFSFERKYGIPASQWVFVKAMAGCDSDNVKGILGVGEKTAIKYLQGGFRQGDRQFDLIFGSKHVIERNLSLVTLPLAGTDTFELRQNSYSSTKFERLAKRLGMEGLLK